MLCKCDIISIVTLLKYAAACKAKEEENEHIIHDDL